MINETRTRPDLEFFLNSSDRALDSLGREGMRQCIRWALHLEQAMTDEKAHADELARYTELFMLALKSGDSNENVYFLRTNLDRLLITHAERRGK